MSNAKKKSTKKESKLWILIAAIAAAVIITGAILLAVFVPGKSKGGESPETLDRLQNPDIGFYRTAFVKLTPTGGEASAPLYDDAMLYHLRVDISAFSGAVNGTGDTAVTAASLDKLDSVLDKYEKAGRSVIVRFAYDPGFGGAKDKEPALEVMLSHIDALSTALNAHTDTLTAVETGMVGPWGEMHTSAAANAQNINALVGRFMQKVNDVPIAVRTPKMIYSYFGITIDDIDTFTVPEGNRLTLFNDGYLGSDSDLGTYTDRAKETDFLAKLTATLPYGGEVTVPSSKLHDIEKCTPEMFKLHLSYLNYEWNDEVVKKWKNTKYTSACGNDSAYYGQSAFTYIQNRLGYRLVVKNAELKKSDRLDIKLDIENVGFGNFIRKKTATLIFVNGDGDTVKRSAGTYVGGDFTASAELPPAGEYKVYLMLHSGSADAPTYPVALANKDMYDSALKANLIGKISV